MMIGTIIPACQINFGWQTKVVVDATEKAVLLNYYTHIEAETWELIKRIWYSN